MLALSRSLARLQRGQDADHGQEAGGHVHDLRRGHDGTAVRVPVGAKETAERAVSDVVPARAACGPSCPYPVTEQ
jgi:hypothetical protein